MIIYASMNDWTKNNGSMQRLCFNWGKFAYTMKMDHDGRHSPLLRTVQIYAIIWNKVPNHLHMYE